MEAEGRVTSLFFAVIIAGNETVTIPAGRLDVVSMVAFEKLNEPIFIGGRGSMSELLKFNYSSDLRGAKMRSLDWISERIGTKTFRSGEHYGLQPIVFLANHPHKHPDMPENWPLFEAKPAEFKRLVVEKDKIILKQLEKENVRRGIELGGTDLVKLFPEINFHWFLKELEVTMAFDTLDRNEFLEYLKLCLGAREEKSEDGKLTLVPDEKKFRARWAETVFNRGMGDKKSESAKLKVKLVIDSIKNLTDSQVKYLLTKPYTYLDVPYAVNSEVYQLSKQAVSLVINELGNEDLERIGYYKDFYSRVDWNQPVICNLMATGIAHIMLPTSDPNRFIML